MAKLSVHKKTQLDLQKLSDRHRKLIRLVASGYSNGECAEILGMNVNSIGRLKQAPLFQAELERVREELKQHFLSTEGEATTLDFHRTRLMGEAGPSIDKVINLRDHAEKDETQLKAATELLDRAGLNVPKFHEDHRVVVNVGDDERVVVLLETIVHDKELKASASRVEEDGTL